MTTCPNPNCKRQVDERQVDWENSTCRYCEDEDESLTLEKTRELIKMEITSEQFEKIHFALNSCYHTDDINDMTHEDLKKAILDLKTEWE